MTESQASRAAVQCWATLLTDDPFDRHRVLASYSMPTRGTSSSSTKDDDLPTRLIAVHESMRLDQLLEAEDGAGHDVQLI